MTIAIMPEQVVRDQPNFRMPTFEEFVHLYLHHNPQIHTVINKFNVAVWSSFRIGKDLLDEAQRIGVPRSSLPDWAYMAARSKADLSFFGDVVAFVPPMQKNLDYFIVSHPFDSTTVQGKLSERQAQTLYSGHIFDTVLVKTICLIHPSGGYVLASLPGTAQIDWKKISAALGLYSSQRKQIRPYAGSLEEAVGMVPGKVTPLVQASKLPNLATVLIDSGLEEATRSEEQHYLELPLNIQTDLITIHNPGIFQDWRKDPSKHQNDIRGQRDNALVYDPGRNSLAQILEACYGHGKVVVAGIARTQA